jgi:hypothetical protein
MLRSLLADGGFTGVLQQFVRPREEHNNVFRISWTPDFCSVTRRVNAYPLRDAHVSPLQRAVTFVGPTHHSRLQAPTGDALPLALAAAAKAVVEHLTRCRAQLDLHDPIVQLVLYVKIDSKGRVAVLYADSLAVQPAAALNPATATPVRSAQLRLELTSGAADEPSPPQHTTPALLELEQPSWDAIRAQLVTVHRPLACARSASLPALRPPGRVCKAPSGPGHSSPTPPCPRCGQSTELSHSVTHKLLILDHRFNYGSRSASFTRWFNEGETAACLAVPPAILRLYPSMPESRFRARCTDVSWLCQLVAVCEPCCQDILAAVKPAVQSEARLLSQQTVAKLARSAGSSPISGTSARPTGTRSRPLLRPPTGPASRLRRLSDRGLETPEAVENVM